MNGACEYAIVNKISVLQAFDAAHLSCICVYTTYCIFSPAEWYRDSANLNLKLEIDQVPGRFWEGFQKVSSRVPGWFWEGSKRFPASAAGMVTGHEQVCRKISRFGEATRKVLEEGANKGPH